MSALPHPLALVTGATGFVARTLIPLLRSRGYRVRAALRRECSGAWDESVVIGDLNHPVDWRSAVASVDVIFHLAARVHVMNETEADPLAAFRRVNVTRTAELCEAAADAGVRRIVYLSSIKVNGESTVPGKPFSASDAPSPCDAYGVSKCEAESVVRGARIESAILRPPLVYGPGVGANFARLMDAVAAGRWLPLGAIDNRRDLVFVGNLADALIRLGEHPAAAGQTFLISDGEALSSAALIRALANAMNRPSRLIPVPPILLSAALRMVGKKAVADRLLGSLEIDASTLREALAWTPPVPLADALRATVAGR